MRALTVRAESWPLAAPFTISRGSRTAAEVVVVALGEGQAFGRGECVPYPRYGESVAGVIGQIEAMRDRLEQGLDRAALQAAMPAGAARNAIDCALWDLEAKRSGRAVWSLAGRAPPRPLSTAYTLGLDTPERMAAAAQANALRPLLKLKLGGSDDLPRVRAVRDQAPQARLIVDANEAWTPDLLVELAPRLHALGVEMIEQPLPAGRDSALAGIERPVPVCADESCHETADLASLAGKYDAVNVKLDKTGGLTEALRMADAAEALGISLMVGCMIGTSLAMAPAFLVAQRARWVDLDGPLLLANDREPGIGFEGSRMRPAPAELWG